MVVAASFLQFDRPALSDERAWFTIATLRSRKIEAVPGGWSHMLALLLKSIFSTLATAGIALALGTPFLLYAKLGILISDNEGLKMGLNVKGYGGLRPCFKCYNIWNKGKAPHGHEEISCDDERRFQPMRRDTLREYVNALRAAVVRYSNGEITMAALDDMEKAIGINGDLRGLLFDSDLSELINILDVTRFDWMHGFLSGGTMQDEVARYLVAAATKCGVPILAWKEVFVFFLHDPH